MNKSTRGFTIVELLIVIVVIGVLAAIVIIAYTGIQSRAKDTSVISDIRTISKKIEQYKVNNNEVYPSDIATALTPTGEYKVKVNANAYDTTNSTYNLFYCSLSPYSSFAVLATSASGKRLYSLNAAPVQEYTGATIWSNTNISAICGSILSGSTNAGVVGFRGDVTPQWRPWTGL